MRFKVAVTSIPGYFLLGAGMASNPICGNGAWCCPTSSEGWWRGWTPQKSNSRATPQCLRRGVLLWFWKASLSVYYQGVQYDQRLTGRLILCERIKSRKVPKYSIKALVEEMPGPWKERQGLIWSLWGKMIRWEWHHFRSCTSASDSTEKMEEIGPAQLNRGGKQLLEDRGIFWGYTTTSNARSRRRNSAAASGQPGIAVAVLNECGHGEAWEISRGWVGGYRVSKEQNDREEGIFFIHLAWVEIGCQCRHYRGLASLFWSTLNLLKPCELVITRPMTRVWANLTKKSKQNWL